MRRSKILLMVHESLVPPEDAADKTEDERYEWRTEYDVLSTLRDLGHNVRIIGIGDRLTDLRETIHEWRPRVVFNLLEQFSGIVSYDHHVVAYLELMRQPYTGCNPRGMMLSRDKVLAKQVLAWHRIATPAFGLFPLGKRFREPRRLRFPLFVKSATEDASLGISQASIVEDMQNLRERVEFIHEHVQTDALVEEYIDGRELYLGVLGNRRLMTLPVWEMSFGTLPQTQAGIATRRVKWDQKYQDKHGIETGEATSLTPDQIQRLAKLAKRIYRDLHITGFARLDFRLRDDGTIFLLEANANPDLSRAEDFAQSAASIGIEYAQLVTKIVNLGLSYMPEWRELEL